MKKIESKDLVIGQEYYDVNDLDLNFATVFEFVGHKNNKDIFRYVKGANTYTGNKDGLVFFDQDHMYQP